MRFVSIDIETTGLDPETDQILEFAAVVEDTEHPEVPVESLPAYTTVVRSNRIAGHPFALRMNAGLISRIADGEGITADALAGELYCWLVEQRFDVRDGQVIYTVAGKNYNGFDARFLERLSGWTSLHRPGHRVLDPTTVFVRRGDSVPPNLAVCLERAGITKPVAHTALEDACDVVRCLRAALAGS